MSSDREIVVCEGKALRSYKPGESAAIVFRRDDQTVTRQATFGSRD